jgi:hypothetical protein
MAAAKAFIANYCTVIARLSGISRGGTTALTVILWVVIVVTSVGGLYRSDCDDKSHG